MKKILRTALASLALLAAAPSFAAVISGPADLPNNIGGHSNSGLRFTALADSRLDSFVFWNQGADETLYLRDAATKAVIFSVFVDVTAAQQLVDIDWELDAGRQYELMFNGSNGKWGGGVMSSNEHIDIDMAFFSDLDFEGLWTSFTQITTVDGGPTNDVPEPAGLALLGIALLAAGMRRKA